MTRPSHLVLHPLVLAPYPVLVSYIRNADSIDWNETLVALLVLPLVTLTWFAILNRLWNDPTRAGLLTSATLVMTFAFERNVHAAQLRGWVSSAGTREWFVLAVEVAGLIGWFAILRVERFPVRALSKVINAASVAWLMMLLGGAIQASRSAQSARPTRPYQPIRTTRVNAPSQHSMMSDPDPDIYFIVLDAYGRSDVLKSMFNYDNSAFLARMEQRGFYLATASTSNYCQTALSITATLGGDYHTELAGSRSKSRLPLLDLARTNPFLSLLKSRGYKFVSFASGFGLTDGFAANERLGPPGNLSEFNALLLDLTPWPTLSGRGAGQASHQRHRARILYAFDHLPDLAADSAPTFCLAHFVAPHPPFVFDRHGRDISGETSSYRLTDGRLWSAIPGHGGPEDYAVHYRNQAEYISRRVEEAVDQILGRCPRPPIIVIQGDHGPGSHFDPDAPRPNDLRERMSILNLLLIPTASRAHLYPSITPVNTFRLIADACLGTARGLLPDRSFYSSYQVPYGMIDVTEELKNPIKADRKD